jgi:cytidine deaminase
LYAMARRTKKRKYKVQANKITKTIEKWVKSGNPNVKHYHLLLSAEQAALSKNYTRAEENYKKAIVLAARTGHMHHAALCNERYADFLLQELSDEEEAKYRMEEAIRFYEAWGAVGKVEMLKKHL